eukprot:SAG11_NODE_40781_length_199_cov_86.650000_1_plen_51_part_01
MGCHALVRRRLWLARKHRRKRRLWRSLKLAKEELEAVEELLKDDRLETMEL